MFQNNLLGSNPDPREATQMAIKLLGGYAETARKFQISRAAVHQWSRLRVPANRVRMMARLVDHQVTPEQIRPDVFAD